MDCRHSCQSHLVCGRRRERDRHQFHVFYSRSYRTRPKMPGPFSLNTESTYDWITDEWSVPGNAQVTKLFSSSEISGSAWVPVFDIGLTALIAERTAGAFVGRRRFCFQQGAERS